MDFENRRHSSVGNYIFYFLLIVIAIAAVVMLLPAYRQYRIKKSEELKLAAESAKLKAERAKRHSQVNDLENSPDAVEKVAREKFNLVRDGETVMIYKK